MKLREPRTTVRSRGYLADTIALCHPQMLFIIACILTIGHLLSIEPFNIVRYGLATGGVILGVLGAYRINELHDQTTATSIPRGHHKALAGVFIAMAIICAIILTIWYTWWIMVLAIIGVSLIVLYNMDVHPLIHNPVVYALTWGSLPLVFSEMTQSLILIPRPEVVIFGGWAGFIAVYTLWLWGPTTCGRMAVCSRAKGKPIKRKCHSPVLRCKDRLVMPKEIHNHQKVLIDLNMASIFLIMLALGFIKFFGVDL